MYDDICIQYPILVVCIVHTQRAYAPRMVFEMAPRSLCSRSLGGALISTIISTREVHDAVTRSFV